MAVKRKYRLNLRNYGNLPAIMLSQYDEGYALEFEIRDGTDAASDLSAYTVTLKGTRADTLAYSFAGTVSTNVLTFVIDTTMTACAGRGTAEIAIKDTANDVLFATFNMPVFVERAAVPEGSIDADVERAQEIAEQVQEIVDNAAEAVSGEAERWATGQINGTDVPSTDPTYENNAKYYAEQAADAAESIGIDATLTQTGKAADAKKTGDEITALKEDLNVFRPTATSADVGKALIVKTVEDGVPTEFEYGETGDANAVPFPESPESKYGTNGQVLETLGDGTTRWKSVDAVDPSVIESAVSDWLDEHPEATTTVQDWSLTENKMVKGALGFVTPEMFGAVGDGETDDTDAIKNALDYAIEHGCELKFAQKTYMVTPKYDSGDYCAYTGVWHCGFIGENDSVSIDLNNATIKIGQNSKQTITIFFGFFADGVTIKNGTLIGDLNNESYGTGGSYDASKLIWFYDCINSNITNVRFSESKGDAVGFNGKEKTQPTISAVTFRDVYSNNAMRDCTITNCQRDGITITKGRGLFFENIYMDQLGPLNGGIGVDVEPYYGYGSVFDLQFSGCTIINAGNGIYLQNCENVIVDTCYATAVSARECINYYISNNNLQKNIGIITGTGVIIGNVTAYISIDQRDNPQSIGDVDKSIRIINNIVNDGIQVNDTSGENRIQYRLLEIRGNTIHKGRTTLRIGTSGKPSNYGKVIVRDNIMERYEAGDYSHLVIYNANDVDIINNIFLYDYTQIGAYIIEVINVSNASYCISGNIIEFPNVRNTLTAFRQSFIHIKNCENITALIKGNVYNPQRIPKTAYGIDNYFLRYTNLSNSHLSILDNYCYGVVTFVVAVSDITLCMRNIVNDTEYTYTPPSS